MQHLAAGGADLPLILTIDIGSSSTRAMLYDGHGRAVAGVAAQEHYTIQTTAAGAAEANPDMLLACVARCIDAALLQASALATRIRAVAVTTLVTSMLAIDEAGHPLTPLITYADTRSSEDAADLRRMLDEQTIHERTGCLLRSNYWPARLAWLRRTRPAIWRSTIRWLTLGEYLELRLFGSCRVSFSVASWSGLLDRHRLTWDAELLGLLGVAPEQLSPLVDIDEPARGLVEAYAVRWPALRELPWFPAVGDGAAANIGSGCIGHQRIALTIGTTGALRVVQREVAAVPPGLWCYRVDREHALVGGATSEGGNVYAWLRETLNASSLERLEAAIAALPPDGHGLTVLPFLAGERSPGWAGNVRATIHGLVLTTTPAEILQASLEAVAYRFALIEQQLCAQPGCPHRIIANGGALLRSPAWLQIFADVLGRAVVVSAEPEATSRGAALLALRAPGVISALDELSAREGQQYEPDPARHAIYQEAIVRQQWLYARLVSGEA